MVECLKTSKAENSLSCENCLLGFTQKELNLIYFKELLFKKFGFDISKKSGHLCFQQISEMLIYLDNRNHVLNKQKSIFSQVLQANFRISKITKPLVRNFPIREVNLTSKLCTELVEMAVKRRINIQSIFEFGAFTYYCILFDSPEFERNVIQHYVTVFATCWTSQKNSMKIFDTMYKV